MSVLPVPGGPYRRTPFGGSIPRRSNSSACLSGSSIISRTFISSSLSPPMSSYVTVGVRTSPSRTGSSFISMIVSSWIWTMAFVAVLMTMNGNAPPMSAIPGTMTTSPLLSGRFNRPRLTKFSIPWPNEILWPSLMIGAIVMRSAGRTSALRTSTLSPRLTPTFRRTRPSMRMMPLPSSSCMTRKSFAAVGGQLAADAEKATVGLHADLLRLNRRNLRCPAQIDRDFLGLQPAVDANGSARSKFLGGDSPLDGQRTTRGNLFGLDGAVDLERAARLDLFGLQTPGDSRRARRPEFLHMHIGLEDAGPGDARGLGLQGTLDPRTARRLELDRLDRVPAHDAAAEDLDRLLAQLRPDSREIDRTHRFANDVTRMLRMAARHGRCLRDHGPNRFAEVRHRRRGRFRLLRFLRFRIVAGFDLQVRLFVDLAPREPFFKLSEDVLPLHWFHRKVEATAK